MIAEPIVSFVIGKLGDLLLHQGATLFEVSGQVEWLKGEFEWMQAFLKDADMEQNDERVKKWVAAVRDIAYKAEDAIDNFILQIEQSRRRGSVDYTQSFTSFVDEPSARHQLGKKIEEIKSELVEIRHRRKSYGIKNLCRGEGSNSMRSLREQRRTSPLLEDTEVVGFQDDINTLVARLIGGDSRRCVISIVGMGGLGKTTLARKVYNHDDVKKHFQGCAWIYVSQEYDARDLLQSTMRCFMILAEVHHKMNVTQLKEELFKHLEARRYFLVLDDMWKTEAWNALAAAFPDRNNGSRVLLTTRNKEVASFADARSYLHELQLLGEHESWKLFCKKTFVEQDSSCPTNLEVFGRKIVAKCHGLPLAVVVIGGLLSRKARLPREWEKSCFLHLGVYPEDHEFSASKLIQLWVAEEFVQSTGPETLEEAAEDCLVELNQRSLIQIVKGSSMGGVKSCRIHDLLRDLSISKARAENFLNGDTNSLSPCKARRLFVHHGISKYTSLNQSNPCLRSILSLSLDREEIGKNQLDLLYRRFHLLNVLHLHGIRVDEFPTEIGTLIHLRYLGLTGCVTRLRRLPSSIANLCNLQTLEVDSPNKMDIPSEIWKMQQLRHVRVPGRIKGEGPKAGELSCSSNLQTLTSIDADDWIQDCLGELINLRKLKIERIDFSIHRKRLFDSIPKLVQLQSLTLHGYRYGLIPLPLISNLLHLYKLCLRGGLARLPEFHEFSPNLTKLTLEFSCLVQDPMMTLEKLKNLRILRLLELSYLGRQMVCSSQGFPQLESLDVHNLLNLEGWRVEEGAMSSLLHLNFFCCRRLKMLPEGLEYVTTLRKLNLHDMPQCLIDRLREDGGEDLHKIHHIPSIHIKGVIIQN
ncbi:probable disease resistance RPP8-like protein 2 [Magnolia sinica]|uniref:probable disease resistance RPP8-like protein 2 n=1 Tax=Magnolia sinica TaxID=86752 RepID=UPI002658B675|nr:probable disease resistance RPP8-like protein 2 [Magnolia sinica]